MRRNIWDGADSAWPTLKRWRGQDGIVRGAAKVEDLWSEVRDGMTTVNVEALRPSTSTPGDGGRRVPVRGMRGLDKAVLGGLGRTLEDRDRERLRSRKTTWRKPRITRGLP